MKRFVMAVVLAGVLSGTTLAGDIQTPGAPSPQGSSAVVATLILTILGLAVH